MKKEYNILFMALVISFITVGILSVYADSSNSLNGTNNSTNSTTKAMTKSAAVHPNVWYISVEVDPSTVDLGNLTANGITNYYPGATTVTVTSIIGINTRLYVHASGNLINGSNQIPLSNLRYDCNSTNPHITETSFTTSDVLIENNYYFLINSKEYTMDYYFTVPVDTSSGIYNTSVTYTAM